MSVYIVCVRDAHVHPMLRKRFVQTGVGLLAITCMTKLIMVSANDELPDIYYSIRKATFGPANSSSSVTKKKKRRVVILGTGWGGMSVVKHLDQELIDVTIVSPRSHFFYTPLLAGSAVGSVSYASIMESIRWYLPSNNSSFIQGQCVDVNISKKEITCQSVAGRELVVPYDDLIIAVGAAAATFGIPGVKEHCFFMKEISDSIALQKRILLNLEKVWYIVYSV